MLTRRARLCDKVQNMWTGWCLENDFRYTENMLFFLCKAISDTRKYSTLQMFVLRKPTLRMLTLNNLTLQMCTPHTFTLHNFTLRPSYVTYCHVAECHATESHVTESYSTFVTLPHAIVQSFTPHTFGTSKFTVRFLTLHTFTLHNSCYRFLRCIIPCYRCLR